MRTNVSPTGTSGHAPPTSQTRERSEGSPTRGDESPKRSDGSRVPNGADAGAKRAVVEAKRSVWRRKRIGPKTRRFASAADLNWFKGQTFRVGSRFELVQTPDVSRRRPISIRPRPPRFAPATGFDRSKISTVRSGDRSFRVADPKRPALPAGRCQRRSPLPGTAGGELRPEPKQFAPRQFCQASFLAASSHLIDFNQQNVRKSNQSQTQVKPDVHPKRGRIERRERRPK